ncbi:Histone-lysine N-methyltransferase [Phytophthora nicotianae]|uniref:Histone-lysine N-methyltransferase n=1 Tax=Phytophthora nicotianae TaxID=4792 RepID=A0A0W8DU88_PHYNI|nr:Histone-lysine N-methyltransferase [Phytophthora nicotianae]
MTQHRRILVVLVVAASLVNTFAIDWTFWNDDDGSSTPTPAKVTSPSSSGSSDLSATVSIIGTSESSSSLYLSLDEASAKALVSATSSSAAIDAYTDKLDLTIPKVTEATSSVTSEYRNWVGPDPCLQTVRATVKLTSWTLVQPTLTATRPPIHAGPSVQLPTL